MPAVRHLCVSAAGQQLPEPGLRRRPVGAGAAVAARHGVELHREPVRPPPPYPSPDPFEPFAVAAVQLADEGLIVLGKVVDGTLAADLEVGMEMELTTMPLFTDDDGVERITYGWRRA